MSNKISNDEYNRLQQGLKSIFKFPNEQVEITNEIPTVTDLSDSNKGYSGKLSMLFVDMRKSTELTDELKSKKMIKIYRSYLRMIVQAIRYSGGFTRQFAGDGVLGVFGDTENEDGIQALSSQKAIDAARKIITYMDYGLNPLLSNHFDGLTIGCGIGVNTGEILITKAGMRGKEHDDTTENESSLIWIGKATNYASKFCNLANSGEIFIDDITMAELSDDVDSWHNCTKTEGLKVYNGFTSNRYYLDVSEIDGIGSPLANDSSTINSDQDLLDFIISDTKSSLNTLMEDVKEQSKQLGIKNNEMNNKLKQFHSNESIIQDKDEIIKKLKIETEKHLKTVNKLKADIQDFQNKINQHKQKEEQLEKKILEEKYDSIASFFSDHHCKHKSILEFGKEFWVRRIDTAFNAGEKIGKSIKDVKRDLHYYLVDIYETLSMWEEAYDALCIQSQYGGWLSERSFEKIVKESSHWFRILNILHERINPGYTPSDDNDFLRCYKILNKMGHTHESEKK